MVVCAQDELHSPFESSEACTLSSHHMKKNGFTHFKSNSASAVTDCLIHGTNDDQRSESMPILSLLHVNGKQ